MCSAQTAARQMNTGMSPWAKQAASFDICAVMAMATAVHVPHHPFMKVCVPAAGWRHWSAGVTHDVHL